MRNRFIKKLIYNITEFIGPLLSDLLYSRLLFAFNCFRLKRPYYAFNFKQPSTFNEKINHIKFNERNRLAPIVADKFAVREYVKQKIGEIYLIPLITTFGSVAEITIDEIHENCIFKMNNGSGSNLILQKDSKLDIIEIRSFFQQAFLTDVFLVSREWHYPKIKPCVIVEKLLGANLNDYKFFCNVNGPFAIQVDTDRFIDHRRNIYDLEWNLLPFEFCYSNADYLVPKPKLLNEMIRIAAVLCRDFKFSRIDLYEYQDKIWFGEITLHPEGGVGPFDSYKSDLEFGKYINI